MKKEKTKPVKKEVKKQLKKAAEKIDYKKEWEGMPEFEQPDRKGVKQILVNFDTADDVIRFAKLIGQNITAKTRSIWFPYVPEETALDKRWSDSQPKKKK